ncbi:MULTISPECIES: dihydrolipoamide acetyltransferase family protein [unclassified Gordonia (in: high G+C Gram-positive bacteria)]|uniref:dihydrolipoamide acetyltransferase family protein n=1 Tax=Gordonia TaxID=2053 RepID=UPI000B81C395|nr:2-oxo acid dehydrogenase subunit E2 [Gordonia sp. SCSIO 19800]
MRRGATPSRRSDVAGGGHPCPTRARPARARPGDGSGISVDRAAPRAPAASTKPVGPYTGPGVRSRVRISPAAARRARELAVDPGRVRGTGPDGAITLDDVEHCRPDEPDRRASDMRRTIAAAMSRSKREIPHYYLAETIPMEAATRWLSERKARRPVEERILSAVLFLKAVALAAQRYPEMNGFWRDDDFTPQARVHVGVAIALRRGGLIAPAIHDVTDKSLDALQADLIDLVARARSGRLRSSEFTDSTITVTNLGDNGVETVFGAIYPPQVALVGTGTMTYRPWVIDGEMRPVPLVNTSLSADHRASDGRQGARFLCAVRELLQQPNEL